MSGTVMELLVGTKYANIMENAKSKTLIFLARAPRTGLGRRVSNLFIVHIKSVCMELFVYQIIVYSPTVVHVDLDGQADTVKSRSRFLLQNL